MSENPDVVIGIVGWLVFCGLLYGLFHNVIVPLWNFGRTRSQRNHEVRIARIIAGKE